MGVKIETTSWVLALIGVVVVGIGLHDEWGIENRGFWLWYCLYRAGFFDMVRPKVNNDLLTISYEGTLPLVACSPIKKPPPWAVKGVSYYMSG
jgi:hypothetical protein